MSKNSKEEGIPLPTHSPLGTVADAASDTSPNSNWDQLILISENVKGPVGKRQEAWENLETHGFQILLFGFYLSLLALLP